MSVFTRVYTHVYTHVYAQELFPPMPVVHLTAIPKEQAGAPPVLLEHTARHYFRAYRRALPYRRAPGRIPWASNSTGQLLTRPTFRYRHMGTSPSVFAVGMLRDINKRARLSPTASMSALSTQRRRAALQHLCSLPAYARARTQHVAHKHAHPNTPA